MGKICIPIVERTLEKAKRAIREADRLADLVELRVDYLREAEWPALMQAGEKPLIVTNRRREEGGKFRGTEQERLAALQEAVFLRAPFVDVEMATNPSLRRGWLAHRKETQWILSCHRFQGTPSAQELRHLCRRMIRCKADVIKIVTLARVWEDNLKILALIPYARKEKQRIVAFCMGEKGKMSRIFAPLMGAAWTYASLDQKKTSAPGQLAVKELRQIWESLK